MEVVLSIPIAKTSNISTYPLPKAIQYLNISVTTPVIQIIEDLWYFPADLFFKKHFKNHIQSNIDIFRIT